jgi:transcriptional regulator with XRE-family HTH domain
MTVLAQNLKTIRQNLSCTQMAISQVLDIGFRTYVRYEAGERDAPVAVLVKLARLGNISLDRLLTTPLTLADLKIPDVEDFPRAPKKMEVIIGGPEEGRVMFKGLLNDHLISTNKNERNLLSQYRALNRSNRDKCLLDAEWVLHNPQAFKPSKGPHISRKTQKAKNAQILETMAKSIKKTRSGTKNSTS